MERFRPIRETRHLDDSEKSETPAVREPLLQVDTYDSATETTPEQIKVREYLDAIDEDMLKDIYAEYFRRSGAEDDSMNWIPLQQVRILYKTPEEEKESPSPYGSESVEYGVKLYSHLLSHDPEQTLWTLIHEQCHAISQDRWRDYIKRDKQGEAISYTFRNMSGVSLSTEEYGEDTGEVKKKRFLEEINEGITELLTERIFREYKKRTGTETYDEPAMDVGNGESQSDRTVAEQKFGAYKRNWQNAKLYIGILSALSDIPKDVVEKSVIRTYIRNGHITPFASDSEVEEIFNEKNPQLSQTLYDMLCSQTEKDPSLRTYVDLINLQGVPSEAREKIVSALQEIKNEWGEAYKIAPNEV